MHLEEYFISIYRNTLHANPDEKKKKLIKKREHQAKIKKKNQVSNDPGGPGSRRGGLTLYPLICTLCKCTPLHDYECTLVTLCTQASQHWHQMTRLPTVARRRRSTS